MSLLVLLRLGEQSLIDFVSCFFILFVHVFFIYFFLCEIEQSRANPVLVPRGLPTAQDYQDATKTWLKGGRLVVTPALTRDEEEKDGYFAVLEKA